MGRTRLTPMRGLSIWLVPVLTACTANQPQPAGVDGGSESGPRPDTASRPAPVPSGTTHVARGPRLAPPPIPAPETTPCPSDMVLVGRFCIDRYEDHLRTVTPDGIGEIYPHFKRPAAGSSYLAVSSHDVFPQGYISRVEAQAACQQAGKRLCTRGEWLLGCRGTPAIPRAGEIDRPCNNGKPHLLTRFFGGGRDYEKHFNSPELNQTPGFLAKTGAYAACESALGVHDMVGNLHEWVSDTVTRSFLTEFEAEGVRRQFQYVELGNGIFMGGFYSTTGELGSGCLFTTVAHDASYHDYSTGFRCCRAKH